MKVDGLKLALVLISGINTFIAWLKQNQLLQAGADAESADSLRKQAEDENKVWDALRKFESTLGIASLRVDDGASYFRD